MTWGNSGERAIIHVDGDAFFAACEQAVHPEYRGRAVICGKERGIVAAASYEAKARGVSRGVPLHDVKKIIPDAIIVPSDYETYSLFSERMFAIMRRFTSEVEEYGIDEGFADITGLQRPLNKSYTEIAKAIQKTIATELEISVSIGLASSKVLAKLGSKHNKPHGLVIISNKEREQYLRVTPIEKIWGLGPATAAYCYKLGIKTALDFAQQPADMVKERYTKPHIELWQELNGQSIYPIVSSPKDTYSSIGKTKTFTPPSKDKGFLYAQLLKNVENACIKTRRYDLVANKLSIYLRRQDFKGAAIEGRLSRASAYPSDLASITAELFEQIYEPNILYRATGVVLSELKPDDKIQTSLFESPVRLANFQKIYAAVDNLSERYGKHTVYLLGSQAAHRTSQHLQERGDMPTRKLNRLRGETSRQHLTIPMLLQKLN